MTTGIPKNQFVWIHTDVNSKYLAIIPAETAENSKGATAIPRISISITPGIKPKSRS